jgi:DDE superfamily endonuclease
MPAIVEFPTLVEAAVQEFGAVFANEPERRHFAEYLTGLLVAERKTVSGINREFAVTTEQSCLNRWITEVDWDVAKLNEQRLAWLQRDPTTRYAAQGVIALDNTLVDHAGELIEDVGWFWDHADQRHLIAHDYLIANYVCPSGKHYALEFRRFRKQEACAAPGQAPTAPKETGAPQGTGSQGPPFKSHTELFKELVDWVVGQTIPGDFTFDCYFTNAPILNHIHGKERGYVGDLKFNRKVWFQGRELKAAELAAQISPESRKLVQIGDHRQWYFTKTLHIPEVDHPVRIVILWDRRNGKEAVKMLVTNRIYWEVTRILRVYRRRWTGTETFHRDGKQQLGMGDCQLRTGEGQTRHMYLVMLAHSLLMAELRQGRASEWAHRVLTTIGEACRAVLRETLGKTIRWAIERATFDGWSHEQINMHLALA